MHLLCASLALADAAAHGLARLRSLKVLKVDLKVDSVAEGPVQAILPAYFAFQLHELTLWLGKIPDRRQIMRSLLSCIPTLEKLVVSSDQSRTSLQGPVSPSLREISVGRCAFADTESLPMMPPSFVNRKTSFRSLHVRAQSVAAAAPSVPRT